VVVVVLGRSGAGNNGRGTDRVEDAPARMCITPAAGPTRIARLEGVDGRVSL